MPDFVPVLERVEAYESSQGMVLVRPDATIALIPMQVFGLLFRPAEPPPRLLPATTGPAKRKAAKAGKKAKATKPAKGARRRRTTGATLDEIGRRHARGEGVNTIALALGMPYGTVWRAVKRLPAAGKAVKSEKSAGVAPADRCPGCGRRTQANPCSHCHMSW